MYGSDWLPLVPHHIQLAAVLGARVQVFHTPRLSKPEIGEWRQASHLKGHPSYRYRIHPDDAWAFTRMGELLDNNMLRFEIPDMVDDAGKPIKYRVARNAFFDKLPISIVHGPWVRVTATDGKVATVEIVHKGRTDENEDLLAALESGEYHKAEEDSGEQDTRTCW